MQVSLHHEQWPIRGTFSISRGAKTSAEVVVVTVTDGEFLGWGECVPYGRYGETVESVLAQIESILGKVKSGVTREELQSLLPAGAARNAVDCALWDLEAKKTGKSIWELVGIKPESTVTAYTVSLDTPEKMAAAAQKAASHALLKLKLGGEGDEERLRRVRDAAPASRLIVDVNEGWTPQNFEAYIRASENVGVELIEQPLPDNHSSVLQNIRTSITICADESAHTSADIPKLIGRYSAVNIKLDKTGGLTEALVMTKAAKDAGLSIMVGCMVSTSLSIAPATVVAQYADYVDLDGPLLLQKDRDMGIEFSECQIYPTTAALWG